MTRYVFLILLAALIVACGGPPAPTPDRVATQLAVEETAAVIVTPAAPTATPKPTNTSTPLPTSTPALTVTPSASSPPTPFPTTPAPTPTVATRTRSQDGMSLVAVPAGDFIMGTQAGAGNDDERPVHTVTLDAFWIDRTEVTNAQYRAFVRATGHRAPGGCQTGVATYDDETKANHPVVCVSWDDAQAYCKWAGARLPTEAEWEKAARGTDGRPYPWGTHFDGSRVNYCDINCELSRKDAGADDGYAESAPVGSYPAGASPYGALDMVGNVWEWVSDWFTDRGYSLSTPVNPHGPASGQYRTLRGGSWNGTIGNARTGFRAWMEPDKRDVVVGFRCVVPYTPSP